METPIADELAQEDAVQEVNLTEEVEATEAVGRTTGNRRTIGVPVDYTFEQLDEMKDEVLRRLTVIDMLEIEKKAEADRINGAIKGEQSAIKNLRTKISEGCYHEPRECELVLDWDTKKRHWVDLVTREVVQTEDFLDTDYQRDMFETERENEAREAEAELEAELEPAA